MFCSLTKRGIWWAMICTGLLVVACSSSATDEASKESRQVEEPTAEEAAGSPGTDYAAMVNGTPIMNTLLDEKMNMMKERYASMGIPMDEAKLSEIRQKMLNSLIEQELLHQESRAKGIKVDPADVDGDLKQFKGRFESEADYSEKMKEINYTEEALKAQIEKGRAIRQLIDQEVVSGISISESSLKSYYDDHPDEFSLPEQVMASHILVKIDENADEKTKAEARKKIETIQTKIKDGEDFAKLASENSDCPSSAKGGDLGYFSRGQMVKPFEDAAFSLQPGQVSDIVETRFGYHLIKLVEKKPAGTRSFDEAKEGLQNKLEQESINEAVKSYIESLKEKGKVEIPENDAKPEPVSG
jgi:peptidyl-prolyl cis-trans isomerase C